MDYLSYIQGIFDDYTVTEELNYQYSGGTDFVIKYIGGGQNYVDSVLQPIQISCYTNDIATAGPLMKAFAKDYSNITFKQDLEFIRQIYSTTVTIATFQEMGLDYTHQIIVTGTLIVSSNIADITKVEIDGTEYSTVTRKLSYVTDTDTQPDSDRIGETEVKQAIIQFNCTMENKHTPFTTKHRAIKKGDQSVNEEFTIKLTYSDNDYEEEYTMKLDSATIDSSNSLSPILALNFTR